MADRLVTRAAHGPVQLWASLWAKLSGQDRTRLAGASPEVARAAQQACIHEEILALPEGYDTTVSERGQTLSGGQRQRLGLARALVRTPPLLLLDEPTSALDVASQATVMERTLAGLGDVAMVVVAHRLATLRAMDRIVVVEAGQIVEAGPYGLLAQKGGRFAAMLAIDEDAA